MRTLTLIGPLVFCLLAGIIVSLPALGAGFAPAEGCYIGAYIHLDATVNGDMDAFEQLVGKPHASYFHYVGYGSPFPFRWVRDLHSRNMMPHIAWEPNRGLEVVQDDDYLRGWAEAAARTEGPIFLRYASEMNGDWEAYSGDPELYIEKWITVARVMREIAPNVIMAWVPFATPQRTITEYYPGDEWVDWVGVNIYSVHHYDGDISRPAHDDPREMLRYVYDLYADRKPIVIGEYAATHFCAACGEDVTEFGLKQMTRLYESLPTEFPGVKMINWFSVDTIGAGLANNNYSITCSPEFLARYRELISDPYFIGRLPDLAPSLATLPETARLADTSGEAEGSRSPAPGPPPTTEYPLALARPGPVSPGEMDIVVTGAPPAMVSGNVEIIATPGDSLAVEMVTFYIDGKWRGMTNVTPFRLPWDTRAAEPGVHEIRAVGLNSALIPVVENTVSVIVAGTATEGG